jgi:hypothetical protein
VPEGKIGKKGVTKAAKPAVEEEEGDKPTFEQRAYDLINHPGDSASKTRAVKKLADDEGLDEKTAQERVESVLVDVGRAIASRADMTERQRFDALVDLYEQQPNFGSRTSTSVLNQAYSTPLPLAFAGAIMADIGPDVGLYEPTGGHGALTITADKGNVSVNEINPERVASLRRQGYDEVTENDATQWSPAPKSVNRVATNPPFGALDQEQNIDGFRIKRLEHLIAIKALSAMKDDGKAFIIVGAKMIAGETGESERIFLNYLLNKYNVVGNFEVDGDLYRKQGAGFPVRMIVVDGRKTDGTKKEDLAPESTKRLATWGEVFDAVSEVRHASEKRRSDLESDGGTRVPDGTAAGGAAANEAAGTDSAASGDGRTPRGGSKGGRKPRRGKQQRNYQ